MTFKKQFYPVIKTKNKITTVQTIYLVEDPRRLVIKTKDHSPSFDHLIQLYYDDEEFDVMIIENPSREIYMLFGRCKIEKFKYQIDSRVYFYCIFQNIKFSVG